MQHNALRRCSTVPAKAQAIPRSVRLPPNAALVELLTSHTHMQYIYSAVKGPARYLRRGALQ